LAEDFPAVFNDPATSHRDRKRMPQLLIEDVTLLKTDQLHVHIRFKGGATESLVLPLPENYRRRRLTPPEVVDRIEELLDEYHEEEIAERLNAERLLTGVRKPFDAAAVRWVCYSHGLKTPIKRLRDEGKLTVREVAERLGVTEDTVWQWARDGVLKAARHGRKVIWLIDPIEEQSEKIQKLAEHCARGEAVRPTPPRDTTPPALRARIEELLLEGHHDASLAECLNAEGWRRRSGERYDAVTIRYPRRRSGLKTLCELQREAGKLTAVDIAPLLGIGLKTVLLWVKTGRLRGQLYGRGRAVRWFFDPIDQQPQSVRQRIADRVTMPRHRELLSDAAVGRGAV